MTRQLCLDPDALSAINIPTLLFLSTWKPFTRRFDRHLSKCAFARPSTASFFTSFTCKSANPVWAEENLQSEQQGKKAKAWFLGEAEDEKWEEDSQSKKSQGKEYVESLIQCQSRFQAASSSGASTTHPESAYCERRQLRATVATSPGGGFEKPSEVPEPRFHANSDLILKAIRVLAVNGTEQRQRTW